MKSVHIFMGRIEYYQCLKNNVISYSLCFTVIESFFYFRKFLCSRVISLFRKKEHFFLIYFILFLTLFSLIFSLSFSIISSLNVLPQSSINCPFCNFSLSPFNYSLSLFIVNDNRSYIPLTYSTHIILYN